MPPDDVGRYLPLSRAFNVVLFPELVAPIIPILMSGFFGTCVGATSTVCNKLCQWLVHTISYCWTFILMVPQVYDLKIS